MMDKIDSRSISEHLCTLATLLESEALRCKALGAPNAKELSRRAIEVRCMAEQLWDADVALPLVKGARKPASPAKREREDAASSLQALGLGKGVAALVI